MRRKVGITTTVPVEVIYAAGCVPVDLNNVFIGSESPGALVEAAEREGLPANVCAWVKGIYEAAVRSSEIETIVAVIQGDCSNTQALVELWKRKGKRIIPFSYPYGRDRELMRMELERFMRAFEVTPGQVDAAKARLDRIRAKLGRLDEMTWKEGRVSGRENHVWLVNASDFNGDPDRFEGELDGFLTEAGKRPARRKGLRLGYLGVPPIWTDLFEVIEEQGGEVVFNEMSRQFAMLDAEGEMVEQYLRYTYPYDVAGRVADIRREAARRETGGMVHYVQSFCYRQMEHGILAEEAGTPMLRLEGDRPGAMDGRTRTRVETFLEMLRGRQL